MYAVSSYKVISWYRPLQMQQEIIAPMLNFDITMDNVLAHPRPWLAYDCHTLQANLICQI